MTKLGRLSAIGALLLVAGCGGPSDDGLSEQAFRLDPRRTFERIVNHFKHQYTGGAIAVPTRLGGEGAKRRLLLRFIVEDVRYTVRGCDRPSDPCTAEMTVKTSTHSSLQRVSPPSGEEPSSPRDRGRGETRRRGDDRATGSATAGAESEKGRLSDTMAAESVLRKQDKSREQTCFFSYEDGHWVLTSQLADSSMKRAIEFALASQ
ncbi:MAG: hypothetical protein ACC645_05120 [Pirellulales bacterium]